MKLFYQTIFQMLQSDIEFETEMKAKQIIDYHLNLLNSKNNKTKAIKKDILKHTQLFLIQSKTKTTNK